MLGLKFRRQQVLYGFIADFYYDALRLCLEVDGGIHDRLEARRADEERTQILTARGVRVVRIRNQDVSSESLHALILPWM